MRRLLKFLHTLTAAGLTGAVVAVALVLMLASGAVDAPAQAPLLEILSKVAAWVIGPSMVLTVVTGLLAMVVTPAFQDVAWVWIKAATGILVLEGGLHVIGSIQDEAKRSAAALASGDAPAAVRLFDGEVNTLWVLFGVYVVNIALGVWRPRMPKYPV